MGGEATGVDEVRAAVREHATRGVDVIDVMATGEDLTPGPRPQDSQYAVEKLGARVQEAHGLARPRARDRWGCRLDECRGDTIEHCTFWAAEGVDHRVDLIAELGLLGTDPGITASKPYDVLPHGIVSLVLFGPVQALKS